MIQEFINREAELGFMKKHLSSKEAELIVIYGRRRIGKTELIQEFLRQAGGLYFLGRRESKEDTMSRLNLALSKEFMDLSLPGNPLRDWDSALDYLCEKSGERRLVAVFDEFPFIMEKFPEVLSVMQDKWDSSLRKSRIFIVLCGSSVGMMESILGQQSPLYGRRTGQWKVSQVGLKCLKDFFPGYSMEDIIMVFGVLDAIPGYLAKFDPKADFWTNVKERVLSKGEFLYEEVEILLREEFRDASNYLSILKSIAGGYSKFNEIHNSSHLDKSLISKYLFVLESTGIVKKAFPVTSGLKGRLKPGRGIYALSDNFFNFWIKFVYSHRDDLERGLQENVFEEIKREFSRYMGFVFEKAAEEFLRESGIFRFSRLGKWWHKDKEIDLVALNESSREILFCECKWQDRVDARKVLQDLKEKAKFVDWNEGKRKEHYAIFAKTFRERIKEPGLLLFDLKDMEKALWNS